MHSGHHSTHAHREEEGIFYLCLPPCGCHHLLFSYHIYVCPAPSHTYLQHEQSNFYLLCHCHTSSQPFHLLPKEPRGQRGSEETGLLPVHPLWLVCYNWLERSDLIFVPAILSSILSPSRPQLDITCVNVTSPRPHQPQLFLVSWGLHLCMCLSSKVISLELRVLIVYDPNGVSKTVSKFLS